MLNFSTLVVIVFLVYLQYIFDKTITPSLNNSFKGVIFFVIHLTLRPFG